MLPQVDRLGQPPLRSSHPSQRASAFPTYPAVSWLLDVSRWMRVDLDVSADSWMRMFEACSMFQQLRIQVLCRLLELPQKTGTVTFFEY